MASIELLDFVESGIRSGPVTVLGFEVSHAAEVYEVDTPADWGALVERYPMDVTGTHDGEWRYWGGVTGPWLLPDWARVSDDYAGIHVTIAGCLTSCGRAIPVGDHYTMLAGWVPDATQWLTDASTNIRELGIYDFIE